MNHAELARHYLGFPGAMICGSKSGYDARHPGHRVFFNANLAIDGHYVWYGDLDLDDPKTAERLAMIAKEAGTPVHVLPEHPYRFEPPTREQILAGNLRNVVRIG
jgi:hypothetical protein